MTEHRTLTIDELRAEAADRFGPEPRDYAFRCPNCGDVATVGEFAELGVPDAAGQHCIGRELGALTGDRTADRAGVVRGSASRGCDWAAYGLLRGPWTVVYPDGKRVPAFPLAVATTAAAPS